MSTALDDDQLPRQQHSPPGCDCETVTPAPAVTRLALHGRTTHVQRKLQQLLHAHDVPVTVTDAAFLVADDHFLQLEEMLTAFTSTEQAEVLAAPGHEGRVSVWQAAPLSTWLARRASAWFHDATKHLVFHLQPIVRLTDGTIHGYEALVRAQLGERFIGAGPLLSAAASHDRARSFDALARREAIRQAYPKLQRGETLFINFAPGVVYNPDICLQTTFQACRAYGADFSRLLFEVTESEAFPDLRLLGRILERYRAEGARVALDDLGAGHTSLTYLQVLRPDVVKLDRALIAGLRDGDARVPLVQALVTYAHDLGVEVVAEGIETPEELELVASFGTDFAQGYLLGRPAADVNGVTADVSARLAALTSGMPASG